MSGQGSKQKKKWQPWEIGLALGIAIVAFPFMAQMCAVDTEDEAASRPGTGTATNLNLAEEQWRSQVQVAASSLSLILGDLSRLLTESRVLDADWRARVNAKARDLSVAAQEMKAIEPPSGRFQATDELADAAMDKYLEATRLLIAGVNELDSIKLIRAAAAMEEAAGLIQQATAAMAAQ